MKDIILKYDEWLLESQVKRPLKQLTELGINRKFNRDPQTGDKYETELFPMFRKLRSRFSVLPKKPNLHEFFAMMQNSDNQFYAMVQADSIAQPDVRELWRDLTGQRSSKMKKYNLVESEETPVKLSEIDPEWTVFILYSNDSLYDIVSKLFDKYGIAFADLNTKSIYINGEIINSPEYNMNHILAIEAHEISHSLLNHIDDSMISEMEADLLAIKILKKLGKTEAANILENRYSNVYCELDESNIDDSKIDLALFEYSKKVLK